MLYKYIKYKYHKKNRWLDAYIQDLISDKTDFKPYKIKLIRASKNDIQNNNVLDTFIFKYNGNCYYLDDKNKLHLESKETISDIIN